VTYKPDAWLTRRIRKTVYACAIIQLAARAEIHFICIDTASLVGDVGVLFSVQAKSLVIGLLGIVRVSILFFLSFFFLILFL